MVYNVSIIAAFMVNMRVSLADGRKHDPLLRSEIRTDARAQGEEWVVTPTGRAYLEESDDQGQGSVSLETTASSDASVDDSGGGQNADMLHVAYASDEKRFPLLLPSMISLSRNLGTSEYLTIHLFVKEESMARASKLADCFRMEMRATSHRVPTVAIHALAPRILTSKKPWLDGFSAALSEACVRFYLPEYIDDVERILWLDCDTIIQRDIAPLMRMPMRHTIAARAIEESNRQGGYTLNGFYRSIYSALNSSSIGKDLPDPDAVFFNTGVMLVNVRRWRSENITDHLEEWGRQLERVGVGIDDQVILNLEFQGRGGFEHLHPGWNLRGLGGKFLKRQWTDAEIESANILHWSGAYKPWPIHRREDAHRNIDAVFDSYTPLNGCRHGVHI